MKALVAVLLFLVAAAAMFSFLVLEPEIPMEYGMPLIIISISAIIVLSWLGLFQKSIAAYAIFSTIIQLAYFVLDAGSAVFIGKSIWFALLQAINFTIAGGLFILVFGLLYWNLKKDFFADYAGLYEKNKMLVLLMAVSCLSLGGMPGFNIFVGEFLLYSFLFTIHPALALAAIFAGLVCFIFYFRICYTLLVRKSDTEIPVWMPVKAAAAALGAITVALGVVPHVLLAVLEAVS